MSQLFGLYIFTGRARDEVTKCLRVDYQTKPAPLTNEERLMLRQAQELIGSVYVSISQRME